MECTGVISEGNELRVDCCVAKIIGAVKGMSGEGSVRQIGEMRGVCRDLYKGGGMR